MSRRRMLTLGATAAVVTRLRPLPPVCAATRRDLRFRAWWRGSPVGEHRVAFGVDGPHLTVETHIDIVLKVLFFTVLRIRHDAREIWRSGRLVSVASTTERDGARLQIYGNAVDGGFRIVGQDGPFLAAAHYLTTNSLWDSRIVRESRLIDVHYGGEVGLVARFIGDERVETPQGSVRAGRYQMITPRYAASVFYDGEQRWVKALMEAKGETIEYALAT